MGVWLVGCVGEEADDEPLDSDGSEIVGDQIANDERPQVGQLSTVNSEGGRGICTGTLVGKQTVITAKHCIHLPAGSKATDGTAGSCKGTFVIDRKGQGAKGLRGIAYDTCWVYDPQKEDGGYASDIAFLRLSEPVSDLKPMQIANDARYQTLTAYGYGRSGDVSFSGRCSEGADGNKRKIVYNARPGIVLGTVTCNGDSGGPHLRSDGALVALTSRGGFGLDFTARLGGNRWQWIQDTCKAAEGAACTFAK